jgi:hypothetical protein
MDIDEQIEASQDQMTQPQYLNASIFTMTSPDQPQNRRSNTDEDGGAMDLDTSFESVFSPLMADNNLSISPSNGNPLANTSASKPKRSVWEILANDKGMDGDNEQDGREDEDDIFEKREREFHRKLLAVQGVDAEQSVVIAKKPGLKKKAIKSAPTTAAPAASAAGSTGLDSESDLDILQEDEVDKIGGSDGELDHSSSQKKSVSKNILLSDDEDD